MLILPPDANSKRAHLTDWLEVLALTRPTGRSSLSDVEAVMRIESSDRPHPDEIDPGSEQYEKPEITNRVEEDLEERVVEELEFRERINGSSYPFDVKTEGRRVALVRRQDYLDSASGRLFYLFCLLDSSIREKLLSPITANERDLERRMANVFQICSCIAVGGYLGVEVVSFGFPRATGDGFLPALQDAWNRYGSFRIIEETPYGFDDKLKDGGVDIIAWRHFDDRFAGTLLMFAQVASGMNWKNKSVSDEVRSIRKWFHGGAFDYFLPAICIPFPLWFDLDEPAKSSAGETVDFQQGVHARFVYREAKFGVIFDRGRIARACAAAVSRDPGGHPRIDGIERVGDVNDWVRDALRSLGAEAAG